MTERSGAVETYRRTLDQLATGDTVHPVEELREAMVRLAECVVSPAPPADADDPLAGCKDAIEKVLAIAFPLVDHADDHGRAALISEIRAFAAEAGVVEAPQGGIRAKLALHHLTWAITAHALACDRLALVGQLGAVILPSRYAEADETVFESADLRHSDAFSRGADQTYTHAHALLAAPPLRASIPRLRRDEDLDGALAEAELIAALCFARAHPDRSYCHVIGRGGTAERRVRAHLATVEGRDMFTALIGGKPAELSANLNELYRRLAGADRRGPSSALVPVGE